MLENDLQSRTELTSMSYAAEVFLRTVMRSESQKGLAA